VFGWRFQQGGSVALPAEDIPGVGRLAYVKDPDGNILGLIKDEMAEPGGASTT
jgi:predicted enzyme related to lactoylglutathione lyase